METIFAENEGIVYTDANIPTLTPPYLTFRLLDDFLESLTVDTLLPGLSPDTLKMGDRPLSSNDQRLLFRALLFLGLVTEDGVVSHYLSSFVKASYSDKQRILKVILLEPYPKQVIDSLATEDKEPAEEYFGRFAISDRVKKSCTSFLIRAAEKAGLPMSPRRKIKRSPLVRKKVSNLSSSSPSQGLSAEAPTQDPMVTHLTLGWRRTCTLTHNFELSKLDIKKIGQLLDIITDSDQETDALEA